MFNLSRREKAMRTMVLDECINAKNIAMMDKQDAENFIEAIAIEINWQAEFVRKLIYSTGMLCDRYPKIKFLIKGAISYYGGTRENDS